MFSHHTPCRHSCHIPPAAIHSADHVHGAEHLPPHPHHGGGVCGRLSIEVPPGGLEHHQGVGAGHPHLGPEYWGNTIERWVGEEGLEKV